MNRKIALIISCCMLLTACKTAQTAVENTTSNTNTTTIETVVTDTSKQPEEIYESVSLADYPFYSDLNELYEKADLIIIGAVTKNTVKNLAISDNEYPWVCTVSNINVETIIKGTIVEGDTIEVKQFGGWIEGSDTLYIEDGVEHLIIGDRHLLFLATYDNSPASLLNPTQAMYFIDGDEIIARNGNNISFNYEELLKLI